LAIGTKENSWFWSAAKAFRTAPSVKVRIIPSSTDITLATFHWTHPGGVQDSARNEVPVQAPEKLGMVSIWAKEASETKKAERNNTTQRKKI
jgi:hypothetical protein